jgi:DNA-binding MarR family transcriptional regulator
MAAAPTIGTRRADLLAGLEQEVGVMVRRIRHVIGARARLVHPELQGSSYLMLSWLAGHGPLRASAMADAFGIDKGAISRQVQHLLDLGLVEREPDPADGRATLVSVSAAAVAQLEAVSEERRRWLDGRLSDWSEDDLTQMVELLGRYNRALDER